MPTPSTGHQCRGFVVIFTSIFLSLLTTLTRDVAVACPSTTTASTSSTSCLLVVLLSLTAVPVACRHHLGQVLRRLRAWARLEDGGNRWWLVGGRGNEGERPIQRCSSQPPPPPFVNASQPYINKSPYRTYLHSTPYLAQFRGFTAFILHQTNIKANLNILLVCFKAHLWSI